MIVEVENARLWVEDDGDGPPVVFLHGGLGDSRLWAPVIERLRDSFRCISFDFRFYGRSDALAEEWSHDDDVAAVFDALDVEHAALVGLSLGGRVALETALRHPERVDAVVHVAGAVAPFELDQAIEDAYEAAETPEQEMLVDFRIWAPLVGAARRRRAAARALACHTGGARHRLAADPAGAGVRAARDADLRDHRCARPGTVPRARGDPARRRVRRARHRPLPDPARAGPGRRARRGLPLLSTLVLHDGQNLAEWRAAEAAAALGITVIALPHAGDLRAWEYVGEGLDGHVQRVVAAADGATEPVGVGGSSFGAYAALSVWARHPARFTRVLAMSPALWVRRERLFDAVAATDVAAGTRVWIDVGGRESPQHQADYDRGYAEMRDLLVGKGCTVGGFRDPDAVHHESAWSARLPDALRFLYGER